MLIIELNYKKLMAINFVYTSKTNFIFQSSKYNFYSNSSVGERPYFLMRAGNIYFINLFPALIPPFKKYLFHQIPESNTYGVTNHIAPQETETKYQPSQGISAQGINPGGMIQLAYFDTIRKCQCGNGYP